MLQLKMHGVSERATGLGLQPWAVIMDRSPPLPELIECGFMVDLP